MSLLRVDDGNVAAAVAVVQRRGFCHFASTTERAEQLPNPELGTVSVIGTTFQYWTGSGWSALLVALTTTEEDEPMSNTEDDPAVEVTVPVVTPDADPAADPDDDDDDDDA